MQPLSKRLTPPGGNSGKKNDPRLRQLRNRSRGRKGRRAARHLHRCPSRAKAADLCDDCAGKMPGRPAARRGRRPKSAAYPPRASRRRPASSVGAVVSGRGSRLIGAAGVAGWPGERRKGLAAPRSLPGEPRSRALVLVVPNRAEVDRVERDLLARPSRAPGWVDRDIRRPVRVDRARRRGAAQGRDRVAAGARPQARPRRREPERAAHVVALLGLRRHAAWCHLGAGIRPGRPNRGRGRSRRPLRRLSRRAREPWARRPRPRARSARSNGSRASCPPGTAGRCSPTGSRISPALSGRYCRHSRAARRSTPPFPTSPAVRRSRRWPRPRPISPISPTGRWRNCRPPTRRSRARALAHLERAVFTDGRRVDPPPLEGAVRLPGKRLARAARSSSSRPRCSASCATGRRLRPSRSSARRSTGCGRRSRRCSPLRACHTRSRAASGWGRRRSATRCSPRSASCGSRVSRRDLFGFLRSPYSGLARAHADYLEGRLRGLGVRSEIEEAASRCADRRSPSSTRSARPRRPSKP